MKNLEIRMNPNIEHNTELSEEEMLVLYFDSWDYKQGVGFFQHLKNAGFDECEAERIIRILTRVIN